jgi:hypothetical protein
MLANVAAQRAYAAAGFVLRGRTSTLRDGSTLHKVVMTRALPGTPDERAPAA